MKTLEKYSEYVNPNYRINENSIEIDLHGFLPKKNKEFVLAYLNKLKDYEELSDNANLGAYTAFRFISPVNLNNVSEEKDLIVLMYMTLIFQNFKSIKEIIAYIEEV